ncbi:T9SS type A sorting domain-containing protein, partial [Candidatus Poribacteria bacterium]|nr:T9SS type A sorting domain-containing protein [Candidatus Poribacteria bacterium]
TTDVPTSADGFALYFAITAVDQSGNESAITSESAFGPVQSINNVETSGNEPNLNFIRGPTGLIRHNDVVFHWNRLSFNLQSSIFNLQSLPDRFIYRLDNLPAQSTTNTSVAFFELPNGPHRFTLQPADGPNSTSPVVQSFTVNVNTLAENEPNETPATANSITVGMTHLGTLAELDLYRLDVENLASAFYVDLLYAQNDPVGGRADLTHGETEIKIFQNRIADDAQIAQAHVSPDTQGRAVLSFAVVPATYLIAFEREGDALAELNEIPYRFNISTSPIIAPNLAEIEPNATLNAAVQLPLNRAIVGTSWDGNSDLDYYQIDVPEAGILWVGLSRTDGIGSTTLALVDGSETEISTVEISPNSLNAGQIQTQILPGRYFLQITPQNVRSGSAYQLSAFFVRSAKHEPAITRPLRLGETLRVTVEAAPDLTPAFEIVQSQTNAVLVSSSRFVSTESSGSKHQGEYTVSEGDNFERATVVVRLMNAFGNMASIAIEPPIFVDTVPPVIQSVSHNATQPDLSAQPLGIGAELVVTLIGEGNGQAFFKIEELGVSVELSESEEIPGHYVGTYQIKDGDNAESVSLTATLIDAAGNATVRPVSPVIRIDTTPPSITKVQHNGTKVLTESEELVVTLIGEAEGSAEFDIEGVIAGVRMFDDGTHDDGIASDGIYIGVYRVRPGDRADEAALTVRLTDAVGNASTRASSDTVTIDTLLPQIDSITHDAIAPLAVGEILTVELIGEAGAEVQFELIDADTETVIIPASRFLVEMSQIDESLLVSYVSHFIVRDGDVVTSGKVRATLTKENGKSITRTILRPITIDTIPPDPVTEVVAADRPDDEGGWIILSWRGSEADDFDHYNIYQADFPIFNLNSQSSILTPNLQSSILNLRYEIEIDRNEVDFYFVVTAVDKAGNESQLSIPLPVAGQTSSTASARAIDNLSPGPVLGVTASDTPGDFGGRVILAWLNPSVASDFDHYRVYLSPLPIQTTEGLRPILTIPDRRIINVDALTPTDEVDYFFAVTAVDVSGNESILENSSTTGPIQSRNNIGVGVETPVQIVSGPIGIVRQKSVTFHFSEISSPPYEGVVNLQSSIFNLQSLFAYSLDDAPFQLTQANHATFYNLREGNHTFAVRLAEERGSQNSRTFSVLPTFTTEVEPNDVPIFANPLTQNAIVRGVNTLDSDEDWYRIEFTPPLIDESMPLQIDLHFERPAGIGQTTISVFDIDLPQENAVLSQVRGDATTRQRAQLSLGVNKRTNGFLVRVQSERENPGAGYELSLAVMRRDKRSLLEIERNDFTNTPTALPLTEAIELIGRHDHLNDVDWYRLDLTSVETRLLSISFSSAMHLANFSESLETSLQIFANLQGRPEAQIGEMTLSPLNPEPPPITTAVTTGPYLLRVTSNDADNATGITYRLRLQLQEIPDGVIYELEPNNRRSRATPIEIDAEVRGAIWHPTKDEADWFRLPIRQTGILSVGLHRLGLDDDLPLSMRLTDANGVEFASEMSGALSLDVVPGEYFIEVNAPLETDASPYTLIPFLIASASHNAVDEILGTGSELTVTLNWNPGREAMFEITSSAPLTPSSSPFERGRIIPNIRVPMVETRPGIYVGAYLVPPNLEFEDGKVVLTLGSGNQVDNLQHTNRLSLKEPVAIDTLPPRITRVSHSGVRPNGELQPIGVGQSAHIRLIGEVGANGTFRIDGTSRFRIVGDLFDDGAHDDDAADDGIYGGSYTVRLGDNVTGATVIGRLEDLAGNATDRVASKLITFDTEPPSITAIALTVTRNNRALEHPPASVSLLAGDQLTVALTGEIGGEGTFNLGVLQTGIPLFDDGTRGDLQSNDGIYTTIYIVRDVDSVVNATITGRLRDAAGNENEIISPVLVSIDTTPPAITQIEHNGTDRPFFIAGDKLIVQLHGEPGGVATFDIGNFKTAIVMVDDGSGVDVQANDGIYTGVYEVAAGDNAVDTVIIGQLIDASGNRTVVPAGTRITIDAVPPAEITGINASDRLNDQGNVLIVTWEVAKSLPDFARYNIYREAAPIRSTFGLIPIPQNLVLREQTVSEIPVPRNDLNYYIAVTAVDLAGNESILSIENGSSVGPIRALDNIPPPAIVGVTAKNKPDDNGVTLIVNWEPIRTNVLETNTIHNDFGRYLIYVETQSIESVENLKPQLSISDPNTIETEVTIPADDTDFYIAITAIDENENESALDLVPDGSTFGPVKSHDETPPEPVINLVVIDTPGDRGESLTTGWTPQIGVGVSHYQVYLSTLPIRSADDLEGVDSIRVDGESSDFVNLTTPADEFGFYVAIAAVDFGGNLSGLDSDGGSVFGPVQSVSNTIRATARTTISAGFDPTTKIVLPPRAALDGQTIDIFIPTDEMLLEQIDEANHFLVEAHIDEQIDDEFQNTVREFLINGNNKFSTPAELTLSYPAETRPALSPEIENDLRIFSLNTKGRVPRWELVGGVQRVNREERTVTAFVDTLTTFRVARLKLPDTLSNVVVVPNPFIPEQSVSRQVTFLNLTANAIIEIYTLNGARVWSKTVENATGTATWDGRNQSGIEVASGLYIYVVRSDVDKFIGRLMVMR